MVDIHVIIPYCQVVLSKFNEVQKTEVVHGRREFFPLIYYLCLNVSDYAYISRHFGVSILATDYDKTLFHFDIDLIHLHQIGCQSIV